MKSCLKYIIKRLIPGPILKRLVKALTHLKISRARRIFEKAPENPEWLELPMLKTLQKKYPHPKEYGYEPKTMEVRGKSRAERILFLLSKIEQNSTTFLELGCFDGMVSYALKLMWKNTTAIDINSDYFENVALDAGVEFRQMDAAHLRFEDESFDCVFSFNAFEHFKNPELVLREAIRVVRTGGCIYLDFGPLYMSPTGLHAYRSITVPYCQILFPMDALERFVKDNGLRAIHKEELNGYLLENYREIWEKYSYILKKIFYEERVDISHLDLILKYPSCFKSKSKNFDNFIVSSIEVLFRKTV